VVGIYDKTFIAWLTGKEDSVFAGKCDTALFEPELTILSGWL
jgi:hypothetical protein